MAVVLITGCSSGFGYEAALAFARRGDRVFASMRNLAKRERLEKAAADAGLEIDVVALDVGDDDSVADAVRHIVDTAGRLDVLVNNAGMANSGTVEGLPLDSAQAVFDTNLWGTVRCIKAALPVMRAQGSGHIVNVSSLAGRIPGGGFNWAYSASKHAVSDMSDSLAFEVEPFGIVVRSVEPGFFRTEVFDNAGQDEPADSPYKANYDKVVVYYEHSVANGADATIVAEAIVAAATDHEHWAVHRPVGNDAEMLIQAAASMAPHEWAAAVKALSGLA